MKPLDEPLRKTVARQRYTKLPHETGNETVARNRYTKP